MTESSSREPRISSHVTANGSVIVPPRIAHWLETRAGVTDDWRDRLRERDLEAHQVMAALHWAATQYRSDCGTKTTAGQGKQTQSRVWISTSEAAHEMKVTDRCIRKWINTKRLPATLSGGRWLINRNDLHRLRKAN